MATGPRRAPPHPGGHRAGLRVCPRDPDPRVLSEERLSRPRSSPPVIHQTSHPAVSNPQRVMGTLLVVIFLPNLKY